MKTIVSALAWVAHRVPWLVVAAVLALTAVFAYYAGEVEVATGNEGFAPEAEEIEAQERIVELFGDTSSESPIQVLVREEDGDVVTAEGLRTALAVVERVRTSELGALIADRADRPGVFHYLSSVEQAAQAQGLDPARLSDEQVKALYVEAVDGDGELDAPPEQASFLARLASEDLTVDPAAEEVSAEAGMVLVFVNLPPGDAEEAFDRQIQLEQDLAASLETIDTGLEVRPFSFPLLVSGADDFTEEVGQLFALAFAVILVILLFVYWLDPKDGGWWATVRRALADMLLTLVTILLAITWMQGIGYLLQQAGVIDAFSAPTQIVPILLIGLGVDYAIHLTARYREEVGEGRSVDEAMTRAVRTVGIALVLATLTTAIGFLTNVFNPVPALKDFGILAAVGILVAFLLMLTLVPSIRMLVDRRAEARGRLPVASLQSHGDRVLPALMERLSVLAEKLAVPTLVVSLGLGGLGYWGFTQLETRFSFTDFLPADSPYVQTLELLEEEFGGGLGETTQVLVQVPEDDRLTGAQHNALAAAHRSLAGVEDVDVITGPQGSFPNALSPIGLLGRLLGGGATTAPPELLAAAEQVGLGPGLEADPSADMAPLYRALVAAAPETATRVIHLEGDRVDALLWEVTTTAGEEVGELRVGLDEGFAPARDAGLTAIATSQNIIGDVVVRGLTESQSSSLFITIAVAAVVLVINFAIESRRWFLGVITIAPVGLVVLWTYGLMYATGIPFGPVTATLAALAIGIGVPFTIHIARRFQEDRRQFEDADEAMRSTMRHTGGALAGSAFTTMAGFGVLMTSSLVPFRQMGQVTVYAIGLALVAAVVVLPSMLALWDRYHRRSDPTSPALETVEI